MINLPGYRIGKEIYASSRTLIYRGERESNSQKVIVKLMRSQYPNFTQIVQFRNQYTIAKNLNIPGVIQPYSLENYQNSHALIMEDFGGVSLKQMMEDSAVGIAKNPEDLTDFWEIAIQIATILDQLHRQRVIHKDIKPANILINPNTKQVKITDFSIASLLPKESQVITSPNVLEGTLAYLSPEQTGRMNRGIDYRSDFYSLGVTFYELLTGKLPFPTNDPMELVHSHIAKQPPAVYNINPYIPSILSDIVAKLMAKNAEDRYQSALGLKYDLETCFNQWKNYGKITNFDLGKRDISEHFLIPEKLYGRAEEIATLLAAFNRVSGKVKDGELATVHSEMMLVAGYSGIGKTAVVNEIHKPIVRQRGYFIKGKFDQFQRNIPFSAIVQALRDLMGQLLSENPQQIEQWKAKILEAVGENGQVISEVIPEVELLIGKQSSVPELEASAAQNRFNLVFQKFIRVFTNADHPLVIFLDDLQWADLASLKLIKLLMNETDAPYLLLIGAYRDNEVFPAHPLMLTLEEIRQNNAANINTIALAPLSKTDLNYLVADTLSCPPDVALPLTELVHKKTKGNPFFSNQFLKALHEDGLITFNFESRYWQCDISKVRALSLTDDVVEFMGLQLQKLPENTQEVLKLAACIGNSFDLHALAIVHEKSLAETATDLWKALQEGLIIPTSEIYKFFQEKEVDSRGILSELSVSYKFLHDRVQQAAYFLIPEDQKQAIHLKIGLLLLTNTPVEEREEKIFEIVNQLNIGVDLIANQSEKNELAQLNAIAGHKAKLSTAYEPAVRYLTVALKLLPKNSWQTDYRLTLSIYIAAAEAEYLNINFTRSAMLAETAMENAANLLDIVKVYELKMEIYIAQLEMLKAVNTGLEVLEKLGISLLPFNGEESLLVDLPELSTLDNLAVMTDPYKLSAMQILKILCTPVFQAKPEIFPQLILTMIHLCRVHGNSSLSAFAYGFYGLLLVGFGKLDAGYQAGKIALKFLEKFDAKELKAKVYNLFNSNIRTWKEAARNSIAPLQEGVQAGWQTGDIEWGGYCVGNLCGYLFFTEENLESVVEQQAIYIDLCVKSKQEIPTFFSKVWRQLALNFQGEAKETLLLNGESFNESQILPRLIEAKAGTVLYVFYVAKTIIYYHFREYDRALDNVALANEQAGAAFGFIQVPILNFYHSLALLALYPKVSSSEQAKYLEQVDKNQENMKFWADCAPMNHQHRYDLIEAEKARICGQNWQAADLYDRAIFGAIKNKYIQEEALANELAANFYMEWGKEKIARAYIVDAYYTYSRWGAKAKVDDLEERYPQLLIPIWQREKITVNPYEIFSTQTISKYSSSTSTTVSDALDIFSLIKASQVLSGEIQLDQLLSTFMEIVMENAGASYAALILREGENFKIAATANISGSSKEAVVVTQSIVLEDSSNIPLSLINYVRRTNKTLVIDDATTQPSLASDSYIDQKQPKSLLCTPMIYQSKLMGILYLENQLTSGAFTRNRLQVLKVLCSQAAISLENANLYLESQNYSQQLEESYQQLQQAQLQIVQSEKMATIGQLMAGIAHEINNPLGFIAGNIEHALEYARDVIDQLHLYQDNYPNPVPEIQQNAAKIDLDFVLEDLPKIIYSMKEGTERIQEISNSMRIFSRGDTSQKVPFNIHHGIDSTLLILRHRLKANDSRPAIEIVKKYGDLPEVRCYPGQLNQVFMNILANAIDALEESNKDKSFAEIRHHPNRITIITEIDSDRAYAIVRIADNGTGIPKEVQHRIFDHLFTTKAVGKGTGLGLSIARQIVQKEHSGKLTCISSPGSGTEFAIAIPL
ncbi:MAG TPA: AAA family ATPase [Leptolyngbyaceae cyanobacterium]